MIFAFSQARWPTDVSIKKIKSTRDCTRKAALRSYAVFKTNNVARGLSTFFIVSVRFCYFKIRSFASRFSLLAKSCKLYISTSNASNNYFYYGENDETAA